MTVPPDAHVAEHDDLLHAHLAGDVPADAPQLVDRLAACAACRERLDELRSLTDLLERIGGEQRRSLTPLAAPAPGSDRVAATLQALADGRPPTHLRPVPAASPPPSRRAALWRVGLAAASVLAAGWVVKTLLPTGTETREDVLLGDGATREATPSGTVEAFDSFDWTGRPADAALFRIEIWVLGQEFDTDPILEVERETFPWIPNPDELKSLAAASAIYWEAKAYGANGELLDGTSAEARLSSAR